MTDQFNGFGARGKLIKIPESFYSDLLPMIDDLAELKVVLFCMWAVQQREGRYRYITEDDCLGDAALMAGLQSARPDVDTMTTLRDALARAVTRGALLCAQIARSDGEKIAIYLINTERGREALVSIEQGHYYPGEQTVEILPPRPNIYRLYEQEIGVLTPMIADSLKDLENEFPAQWLQDAVQVAVEKQARNLKFIRAVLDRWRKEGKTDHEISGRSESVETDRDGRRFFTGEDSAWIEQ